MGVSSRSMKSMLLAIGSCTVEKIQQKRAHHRRSYRKIKECYDIAPLHNPVNMAGIEAISKLMPTVPQVGVFDTAFHQTMPAHAYMYALPYDLYKNTGYADMDSTEQVIVTYRNELASF